MENVGGRQPYHLPGTPGSPFTFIDRGEGRFRGNPSHAEAWHRTETRLAAGGKFKLHLSPPGTRLPLDKRKRTSSQPTASKIGPLELELVATSSSSQPVVSPTLLCCVLCCAHYLTYHTRPLLPGQAPLVSNANCAPRTPPPLPGTGVAEAKLQEVRLPVET